MLTRRFAHAAGCAIVAGLCLWAAGCARGVQTRENIRYTTSGPRGLHLTLFQPEDIVPGEARSCVLLIHGGSWMFGSRHQLRWYGEALARQGYVAASMSYRKLPRHTFLDSVHDAKAAVRWLRLHAEDYGIDPGRIAVLGNSAGGYLAGMLAVTADEPVFEGSENPGPSSEVQAAVSLYGALDLAAYRYPKGWIGAGGMAQTVVGRYVRDGLGTGGDPFEEASVLTYIGPGDSPMLLVHGMRDSLVPVDVPQRVYELLREAEVPARLIQYPERGHAFDFVYPELRRDVFGYILTFLEQYLGPPVDPPLVAKEGVNDDGI